jgi:hypothetical protein
MEKQKQKTIITITEQIKKGFENGLNNHQIKEELQNKGIDRSIHYIENIIYRIKLRSNGVTTRTEGNKEDYLITEIKEDNEGNVSLFIKTSNDFENYLKENKEIRHTNHLFEGGVVEGDFYYMNLADRGIYDYDDINNIIYDRTQNRINKAIFRVVGISKGLNFKLPLMSEKQLRLCLKKLVAFYSQFYNTIILSKKLNFRALVYGVVEND